MRRHIGISLACSLLILGACQPQGKTPTLQSPEDEISSYGIGISTGRQLLPAKNHLKMDAFIAGVIDGLAEADPAIPQSRLDSAMNALTLVIREEQAREAAEIAERNAAEGAAFLAQNAQREGVVVTESGLQYEVLQEGDGVHPTTEQRVRIHYRGSFIDGNEFDSSYERGQPATFGVSSVIPGFSEGLQLMSVGAHYKLYIPGEIGYGPTGSGQNIPPSATLIFEVEMLEIVG